MVSGFRIPDSGFRFRIPVSGFRVLGLPFSVAPSSTSRLHLEKDLLNKLNIPCLDLETWGCPKYEQLKQAIVEPLASCSFHLNDNIHHCPMAECQAFWLCFQTYVK